MSRVQKGFGRLYFLGRRLTVEFPAHVVDHLVRARFAACGGLHPFIGPHVRRVRGGVFVNLVGCIPGQH